jgi:glycosyltransferase involved in cell wall biosynthesis
MGKIYIIIPAYNEDKRIGGTLNEYLNYFNRDIVELIVVINNTTDHTEDIVKQYESTNTNLKHIVTPDGGKGNAIMLGFKDALSKANDNDIICFVDADNATDPENLHKLIITLCSDLANETGAAIASRYLPGSILEPAQSFKRIIASRLFNVFIRMFLWLPYKDTQCGCKIIFASELKKIISYITSMQWSWDIDFLYQLKKQNIGCIEVPITWKDKEYSKINFMTAGPKMALGVIRLRILNSPFKWVVKIYNKLPKWCKIKIQ